MDSQIARFMGPTWVLSAPDGLHAGTMNFAIRVVSWRNQVITQTTVKTLWIATWRTTSNDIYWNYTKMGQDNEMGLLPDTQNRGLRMRRECRERFLRHRL